MLLHSLQMQWNVIQDFNITIFSNFSKIFAIFSCFELFPAAEALGVPSRFDNKLLHCFAS